MRKIAGIDPGTDRVGLGIVGISGGTPIYIKSLILPLKKGGDFGASLLNLEKSLKKELRGEKIECAGVESLFFLKNKKTGIAVAHARGVILKTLSELGIYYEDFSPSHVKSVVCGSGSADKKAVARMVRMILKKETRTMIDDESDALAIALTMWMHSH